MDKSEVSYDAKFRRHTLDMESCYFDVLQLNRNTDLQISMHFESQVYREMFEWMLELMLQLKLLNSLFVSTVSQILLIPHEYNFRYR